MLDNLKLENILFLDIETVPIAPGMDSISPNLQQLWEKRSANFRKEDESASDAWPRAGLYAEFGRIVCISAGIFSHLGEPKRFRIKSFAGEDESSISGGPAPLCAQRERI